MVGYANGKTANPSYEDVCYNNTGHAETVRVIYDDARVTLRELLRHFFDIIDPIAVNRQGADHGPQYRSGVYFADAIDKDIITKFVKQEQSKYNSKIAVEILSLQNFYHAEEYHQHYLQKNPHGYCHIKK